MIFDELMDAAHESAELPNMERIFLPGTLSDKTKKDVMKTGARSAWRILMDVIDLVNNGSVTSVDSLIRKAL